MTLEAWLLVVSGSCFAAFLGLGFALVRARMPWGIDAGARALLGRATILAALFTLSGRAFALTALSVAAVAAIIAQHGSLLVPVAVFVAQAASQGLAELAKRRFCRKRPDDWIFHQELGFSYPSGHASTAVLFFGSWLVYVALTGAWHLEAVAAVASLAVWIAGIDWSRLALGAHYPSDVAGGTLFGCGWLALLWAALLHFGVVHPK